MALFSWVPIFVDWIKITHSWGSNSWPKYFLTKFIQKIAISWVLEFVDWTLHENHENWYPTKFKPSTAIEQNLCNYVCKFLCILCRWSPIKIQMQSSKDNCKLQLYIVAPAISISAAIWFLMWQVSFMSAPSLLLNTSFLWYIKPLLSPSHLDSLSTINTGNLYK